jgi:heme-degrading monooxygenase HmoA
MIVRVWRAEIEAENLPAYRDFLDKQVFPKLRGLPGNLGAELLVHKEADEVDVIVESRWQVLNDIHAFAGDDISVAVMEPEAIALLKRYDSFVTHYEVALEARH